LFVDNEHKIAGTIKKSKNKCLDSGVIPKPVKLNNIIDIKQQL
jgi:hypothetical protein